MLFLSCALLGSGAAAKERDAPPGGPRVVAYLPGYRIGSLDATLVEHVTDLILFSIEPAPDGGLDLRHLGADGVRTVVALRKKYKVDIHVSVGGWARSKGFAPMTAKADVRARFIRELLRFCRANGFSGADFDWEFPRGRAEEEAYVALLRETKRAFAPYRMKVTVALGHRQDIGQRGYEAVDRVHVMAYDHRGRHSTFEQAKADAERFLTPPQGGAPMQDGARGIPKEKLFLGVPFYGRNVATRDAMTYADILKKHNPAPETDEVAGVHFNGTQTIRRKARYVREQGLGGVMIWELGQDAPGDRSLAKAVREELSAKRHADDPRD